MELGEKLNSLLEQRGITKYQLSQMTNISQSHLGRISKGITMPTVDTLETILKVLNCSMSEFFAIGTECQVTYLTVEEQKLVDSYRSLNSRQQDVLLRTASVMCDPESPY